MANSTHSIPESVIKQDHELDTRADRASEALAKLRWHWTIDQSNSDRVSKRAYARAVGRSEAVIRHYANGYVKFLDQAAWPGHAPRTIQDAIRLAAVAVEDQAMHEAIAEGSGTSVSNVSRGDKRTRTRGIVERAKARAERRGGDPVDHARDIAAAERRHAESTRQRQAEDRQRHSTRFVYIEGRIARAQHQLLEALKEGEGVPFDNEEMQLLRSSVATLRAVLDLLEARLAGTPDIDWDAELARLSEGPL